MKQLANKISFLGFFNRVARLRELAKADQDGRCVALPFKPGENVCFVPDKVASCLLNKSLMVGCVHHISFFTGDKILVSVECNMGYSWPFQTMIFSVPPQNVRRIYEASEETLKKMDGQL